MKSEPGAGLEATAKEAGPSLPYVVSRFNRVVRQAVDDAVREHDVTVNQYTLLSVLGRRPSLSNAQLARRASVSPQSMNELLLGLERSGLVRRVEDPEHGRIRPTLLTPKGRRLLDKCNKRVALVEAEMTAGMPSSDVEALRSLMVKVVHNLHGGLAQA